MNKKYLHSIITICIVLITAFCIWSYIQRASFEYNAQGTFLSPDDGVVYREQAKEVYGILALIGLILIGIVTYKIIKKTK